MKQYTITESYFAGTWDLESIMAIHKTLDNGEAFDAWLDDMVRMDLVRVTDRPVKTMTEWTIRRRCGSIIKTIWTEHDYEAVAIMETRQDARMDPKSATLQFECRRTM